MVSTMVTAAKTARITISLVTGLFVASPVFAGPTMTDTFNRNTAPTPKSTTKTTPKAADLSDPVKWFESMDDLVSKRKPSDADRVILSRSFKQEAERVQEWINVATRVAKDYRALAGEIKALPVASNLAKFKEYRDLKADWYNDTATIYEDLIRPRQASKTMEELEEQIARINDRAKSQSQTFANISAMDLTLRRTYKVHLARQTDSLQQYVRGK